MNTLFSFNKYKLLIAVVIIFCIPLPIFIFVALGFAPPIIFAIWIFTSDWMIVMALPLLIVYGFSSYVMACLIYRFLTKKIRDENKIHRIVLISSLLILFLSFFIPNVFIGDIGGGQHIGTIYEFILEGIQQTH
jgi:hypothetical protein